MKKRRSCFLLLFLSLFFISFRTKVIGNDGTRLFGIDVSHHNGHIDWEEAIDSGISFVFIKVSDGAHFVDIDIEENRKGVRRAKLVHGYYHLFRPGQNPIEQAALFIENLPNEPQLPMVLDIEISDKYRSSSLLISDIKKWISHVEKHTGRTPIIYSYLGFMPNYFHQSFDQHEIWLAQYNPNHQNPTLPNGRQNWTFWQFTQNGIVAGVNGKVDRSFFKGSLKDLKKLVK